jgi:hypothetical protein
MNLSKANLHHYCTACGDCLIWNLGANSQGYPSARIDGKVVNVRRWLWEKNAGRKLGAKQVVRSACGNPRCMAHLAVSTRGELTSLSYSTGHRDLASEYQSRVKAYIRRGIAKLDWDKVREIRARRAEGPLALSEWFGVSRSTIVHVLAGKSWKEHANGASIFSWRGSVAVNDDQARAA